jgi:hypothetical protein
MLAVVQGRQSDRVPFAQYDNLAAPNDEVWSLVGRENMGVLRWCQVHRLEHPNCTVEGVDIERDGFRGRITTISTPAGKLVEEKLFEPVYGSGSARKHFITEPDDYRVFAAFLRDTRVTKHAASLSQTVESLGDDGLPVVRVERTPFQQMWVQWVSLADLCAHLAECPEQVEECLQLLAMIERRIFKTVWEVAGELAIPLVDIPDNITAPAIGPRFFTKYCLPLYQELSAMMAERGAVVFVHMDGDLRPLWNLIGESGVRGLDSMSPPPDNDTSVADARRLWPEMRLWVNFPSSVHLAEPKVIYETARRLIEESGGSGRLQIQISENVPRDVWRKSLPEIVRATQDARG